MQVNGAGHDADEAIAGQEFPSVMSGQEAVCPEAPAAGGTATADHSMQVWLKLLVVLAALILLAGMVFLFVRMGMLIHHTLLLFSLGGLVAYALDPLVEVVRQTPGFSKIKPARELSVMLVLIGLLVLMGLAVWLLEGSLANQIKAVQHDYPDYQAHALRLAGQTDAWMANHGIRFSLTDTIKHPPPDETKFLSEEAKAAFPFVRNALTDAGEFMIVLLIALYFLLFGAEMRERFNAALPPALRFRADLWETDINQILGGFVRGQILIALVMGGAAAAVCLATGIRAWLLIGLFVVVASLIPVFGPYIGAIPAIIAALVGHTRFDSPVIAAVVILVLFVVINEVGSKVLYPKLVGSALGLHTVVVLFVLFAGLEISGVPGVLFAAPLTALAMVSIVHLYRLWQGLPDGLLTHAAQRHAAAALREAVP